MHTTVIIELVKKILQSTISINDLFFTLMKFS
jgi:hypothetical protein